MTFNCSSTSVMSIRGVDAMPRALRRVPKAILATGPGACVPYDRFSANLVRATRPMAEEENAILAEKAAALSVSTRPARTIAPRWLAAAAALPLLGVVAAFGIAPSTSTESVVLQRVLQD